MNKKQTTRPLESTVDIVAAVVLGLMAVTAFVAQIWALDATPTATETSLFNLLQFLLTAGFAWFSTRVLTRKELNESLRQFAIGAYRRIADIESIIARLRGEIRSMIAEAPAEAVGDLRVAEAITVDACQVIQSSIADWADVLGDELEAIEEIRDLRSERSELADQVGGEAAALDRINQIEKRIDELSEHLPAQLRLDVRSELRRAYGDRHAATWIADQHREQGGLRLSVVTGDRYCHDRSLDEIAVGEKVVTLRNPERGVEVVDLEGNVLGRLQNPSPLDYPDFMRALDVCFGVGPLPLEIVDKSDLEVRGGVKYGWFRVRVMKDALVPSTSEIVAEYREKRGQIVGGEVDNDKVPSPRRE